MKKKNWSLFIVISIVSFIALTPLARAASRQSYVINFINSTKNEDNQGFGATYESTLHAIEVLTHFNAIDSEDLKEMHKYLENELQTIFDQNDGNVYDIYYILKSIDLLNTTDYEVNSSLEGKILNFINTSSQVGGGYAPDNTTTYDATMLSTYFALEIISIVNNTYIIDEIHVNWTLSCYNTNGGFTGTNSSSQTSIINTFCALSILNNALALDRLENPQTTINYLSSFYSGINSSSINQGGYLPDELAAYSLLSSTYYCVSALKILQNDGNTVNLHTSTTINWVYSRQNIQDGGFADIIVGDGPSSISSSKYAVFTIVALGGTLDVQVWMVEFDYIVLIVILIVVGVLVLGTYFLHRRRKKML
ncbi:MAG: prenyltransferase/squalene oxidase repeat-containing protein [Promethearchaeota archaeon]